MKLRKKKYNATDVLNLSFEAAPKTVSVYFIISVMEAVISTTGIAFVTALFIDTALSSFKTGVIDGNVYLSFILLIILIALSSILGSLPNIVEARLKFFLERNIKPAILKLRANLSYCHIEHAESWETIELVSNEMSETFLDAIRSYMSIIKSIIAIISICWLIASQAWRSAAVVIIFSIPLFTVSIWAGRRNYAAKVESQKYERRYGYFSDEVLTNRETAEERTLFGYTENIVDRYYRHFEVACNIQLKMLFKTKTVMRLTSIFLIIITFLTAFTLIQPVLEGKLSSGMFIGIIAALFGMVETLGAELQDSVKNIAEAQEYMDSLTSLVNMTVDKGASDLPVSSPIEFKSLEFQNVSFQYPNSKYKILNHISFKMEAGKHYAFVGVNGAGKSTIIKLLTRLYDQYTGKILINDKELRNYSLAELKSLYSIIYQDFARYQITIKDNLSLGNIAKKKSEFQLLEIISKVGLYEMIANLKNGLGTSIGKINPEGKDLSGGQWQKLAIARSLASNAPIKILDEPTAALDPLAESRIYKEFNNFMENTTTIFISHRLGSTKLANKIFVINEGKVIEEGSHQQLIELNGMYAEMFETQRRWYE